eukprot:scaffold228_cov312-Pinguiococcus_pyrenoidosus.AAC.7
MPPDLRQTHESHLPPDTHGSLRSRPASWGPSPHSAVHLRAHLGPTAPQNFRRQRREGSPSFPVQFRSAVPPGAYLREEQRR